MKNLIIKTATLCLVAFSASVFAEKVIITGQPVMLERQGDMYVTPQSYRVSPDYQYVVIDGKERACFLEKKPDLVNLDAILINVRVGGQKATWNCYSTDPTYFTIQR